MTPEERVYTAISGGMPDRVPSFPKIWVDLASRLTGTDLLQVISDPALALEVIFKAGMLCRADGIRQFHFPARKVVHGNDGKVYETDKKGKPIGAIDMEGGLITSLFETDKKLIEDPYFMAHNHYWMSENPMVENLSDAKLITVPTKQQFKDYGWEKRQKEIMAKNDKKMAIAGDLHSATLAFYVELRGMNRAMFDLLEEPRLVHSVMEKGALIAAERGKFNIDMGIKVLRLNDSVGNMSVISPQHWREYIFPHIRDVCNEIHKYDSSSRIYCHICGNILPVAEDLARTGLDCIGPLDPLGGFSPKDIRKRVGDSVSLLGGVDTLSFINKNSNEIIAESRECIRQAGVNGGYILSSGCVIPRSTPLENVEALRLAAEKYGVYRDGKLV